MDSITITPFETPFQATITPPGSKSLTNRALVIAALADGESTLSNVLFAEDTEVMVEGLRALGYELNADAKTATVSVKGRGGVVPQSKADIACANSGTTIRFLTALCTLGEGSYRLAGGERMRQRPIAQLVTLLEELGAMLRYEASTGHPPVVVEAQGLSGGRAHFPSAYSSQYLSAVLMVAPYTKEAEVVVALGPGQTSWPYVEMTARLMALFGVDVRISRHGEDRRPTELSVPRQPYTARAYEIEPDASNATYFMAAAAVRPGASVRIPGLGEESLQGDVAFARVLSDMGAQVSLAADAITVGGPQRLKGIEVDMAPMPDAAMTLAAIAALADGPTTIRGLHTWRVKETDRLAALQAELRKLGARADIDGDTLRIEPAATVRPAEIETYDDHRMAMSFAVVGSRAPGITILGPDCVAKTYPDFFADLQTLSA
ncbi:MAG: 3-phosphoshikimate 1-carboxyvinyltransferase [Chloroflexi bacterium]|nr:3-phosphoshikimate 1-carboxyvinyltransferase [Chloroflexota bacterium]MCI0883841.1 3-phosphoshikimate 1-carboxyvinyltransferase [Chloroflexota bacterium]MCI0885673.1 3-phosphoshikimate 1-carboxyvinyltransferase [Chloroflexota bacterium]